MSNFFSRLKPSREGRIYRWEMICLGEIFNWLIRLLFVLGDIENFVSASYLLLQKVNLRLLAALSGLQWRLLAEAWSSLSVSPHVKKYKFKLKYTNNQQLTSTQVKCTVPFPTNLSGQFLRDWYLRESNLIPMSKKVCEFIERYLDTTSIQFDIFQ